MPKVERIRRLINFNKEVYEKLEEIAEKSGGGIGYLVNLACSFWIETHEAFKEMPRMINELARFSELAEKLGADQTKSLLKSVYEGDASEGSGPG